ncbi:MAG: glycosyltransferase [Anaerolineales bacterium]|nr:glycosyltransferase [Anaerolineales bacterium]
MRILYDGWSLVHSPLSPQSLHLLSILENLPEEIQPLLALPEISPAWLDFPGAVIIPVPGTPWGSLRWEQFHLPSLARDLNAELLHLVAPTAPVFRNPGTVFSPAGIGGLPAGQHVSGVSHHVLDRMRISMGLGGLERVTRVVWPHDLPAPGFSGSLDRLPPILPQGFFQDYHRLAEDTDQLGVMEPSSIGDLKEPVEFILYHGPGGRSNLEFLAQVWNWAAAAIGENFPLLLVGLQDQDRQVVSELVERFDFAESLLVLPGVTPVMLPRLYQLSAAVFHPSQASPWCGSVRLALASGKPLVAVEESLTAAVAGPAAYLVREDDARAFGAALVTVIVEQEIADSLSAAAKQRSRDWANNDFGQQLLGVYLCACKMR